MYGLIPVASASDLERQRDAEKKAAEAAQNTPQVQSLASHVRSRWETLKSGRQSSGVEDRLAQCLRQRRGEYDPDKLAAIRKTSGSEIFMMLTSSKCRTASAWLRDTLTGNGSDKPWGLEATPVPELPPEATQKLRTSMIAELSSLLRNAQAGLAPMPSEDEILDAARQARDTLLDVSRDEAKKRVARMELKMEDQLVEGGFSEALTQFFDDLVTFPTAIMKGPVLRKRKTLKWNGSMLDPVEEIRLEWERVDPFKFYTAPWAANVNDGPVIERHQLTQSDLEAFKGVDGYSDEAITAVLTEYRSGGMREWLSVDTLQAEAEGKSTSLEYSDGDLIDALQLWDQVSGDKLIEWGMSDGIEPTRLYPAEIWLIGNWVIRAVLNYDPLGRKPYYATSFEKLPGVFWGNGVADLIRDCQAMCNAAARALANNMGLSSGPQVGVNVSRLPTGESVESMYPWRIWQFESPEVPDSSPPIQFFQPNSNANELMAVFERFSQQADNDSGIPRYMQGEHAPGVGRTASGLSMMLNNASKGMKQVVGNIDLDVLQQAITRLYQHNLRYSQDPELIGDVTIQAKGAKALIARETSMVRRNEFLQLALSSPTVQSIIGLAGTAELLRDSAKQLDMPVDSIIPSREALQQQQLALQAQAQAGEQPANAGPRAVLPDGSVAGGREGSLMANQVSGTSG